MCPVPHVGQPRVWGKGLRLQPNPEDRNAPCRFANGKQPTSPDNGVLVLDDVSDAVLCPKLTSRRSKGWTIWERLSTVTAVF